MRQVSTGLVIALLVLSCLAPLYAKTNEEVYQEKLARLKPDDVNRHYQLGFWCMQNKLPRQARLQFEKVIKLDPNHIHARKELNYIKYKDKWIKAEEQDRFIYEDKLSQIKENDVESLFRLGKWCNEVGLSEEAENEFKEIIKLNPDHEGARKALGYVKYKGTWVAKGDAEQLTKGYIKHAQFGWVKKEDIPYLEKGLLPFNKEWLPAEEVRKLRQQWENAWVVETEHFVIRTNTFQELAELVAEELEHFYKAFITYYKITPPKKQEKIRHLIFRTLADAQREGAPDRQMPQLKNNGAFEHTETNTVYAYLYANSFTKPFGFFCFLYQLRHETTHALFTIMNISNIPPVAWLNEGFADYNGLGSFYVNGKFTFGVRLSDTADWMANFMRSIEQGTYPKMQGLFRDSTPQKGFYSVYHTIVHFFLHAYNGQYRNIFIAWVFHKGKGNLLDTVYQGSAEDFEKDWVEYCKTDFKQAPSIDFSDLKHHVKNMEKEARVQREFEAAIQSLKH